ncbi:MAG: transposase [Eubacteriales bacterium]
MHHVGTGVPDGPTNDSHHVGTGVPDGPANDLCLVGTGVPDGPLVELSQYGKIADKYINQLGNFYEYLSVERYVIMPNHIHIMLFISDGGPSGTPVPTLQNSVVSRFVSTFKRFCNKEYGKNIWQARSYDHVIRNREDYDEHIKYIYENPVRWYYDELYSEE